MGDGRAEGIGNRSLMFDGRQVCIFESSQLEGSYVEDLTVLQRKALYFFPGIVPAIQVAATRWCLHIHETCPQISGHNQVV